MTKIYPHPKSNPKYREEDVESLITAAKDVGRMASSLMNELGPRPRGVTDWGLVNNTLVGVRKALIALGTDENK